MSYTNELIKQIRDKVSASGRRRLLFIDGDDPRAVAAAVRIQQEGLAEVTMLIDSTMADKRVPELSYVVLDEQSALVPELIAAYLEARGGKADETEARVAIRQRPVYAALLIRQGYYDGAIGGLLYPTADILRAGFRMIGPSPGIKTISSCMVLVRDDLRYIFSDISVNPSPTPEQLSDIALNAAQFATQLQFDPRIAFLSFSTTGSAKHPAAEAVAQAYNHFCQRTDNKYPTLGEIQFDAAIDEQIRLEKLQSIVPYKGETNVYIFPDLNSGNIGYKIAQRLGNMLAIGPIVTGIAQPFNDLSRGATVEDVYHTGLMTLLSCY